MGRWKRADEGFTLIELLLVIVIVPVIVGAIAAGFIATFRNQTGVETRVSDSHDSQITAAYFVRDVRSSQYATTSATPICGSTPQMLGLSWTSLDSSGNAVTHQVSYGAAAAAPSVLVRTRCSDSDKSVLAHDTFPRAASVSVGGCPASGTGSTGSTCATAAGAVQAFVTADCTDSSVTCASAANPIAATARTPGAVGISRISLTVVNSTTGFTFTVTGTPRGWSTTANGNPPSHGKVPALALLGTNPGATLQGSSSCSLTVNGTAAVNSSTPGAISLGNNSTLSATQLEAQSPNVVSGGSSPPVVLTPPLADPYSGLTPPTTSISDVPVTVKSSTFNASGQLDGIYILQNGMKVTGNITTGPDGVLLYVAGGSIDLSGNNTVNLSKPVKGTTTDYSPIVIWVASTGSVSVGGNGNVTTVGGTIYAPNGKVTINGGGNQGGVNATGIVANQLDCQGGGGGIGVTAGPAATTTSVSSSQNPSASDSSVTLTATVTSTSGTPTGNLIFTVKDKNGVATSDCAAAVTLNNGTASCTTGSLSNGSSPYSVTASYQGDSSGGLTTFAPSSGSLTQTVLIGTTTALTTSSPTTITGGTSVTFTATVTATTGGTTPTGTVTFSLNGSGNNTATCTGGNSQTLSNGVATCTTAGLKGSGSPYSVQATYAQTTTYLGSQSNTISMTVSKVVTTTTVTSSNSTLHPSGSVTFTATVSPVPDGGSVTWTVTDKNGAAVSCSTTTQMDASGVSTCKMNSGKLTTAGQPYSVTATYGGNANYATSTGTISQSVSQTTTTTSVTSSKASMQPNDQVTFTATVTPAPGGGTVTWTVKNKNGNSVAVGCSNPTVLNASGIATCQVAAGTLTVAGQPYSITATYSGDADDIGSAGTISQAVVLAGSITSGSTPKSAKNNITDTANVTGSGGTPTGTVNFYLCSGATTGCTKNSGSLAGSDTLNNKGVGKFTTNNLAAGPYCMAVYYQGDATFDTSSDTSSDQCFTIT